EGELETRRLRPTQWGACVAGGSVATRCWGDVALDEGGPATRDGEEWRLDAGARVASGNGFACGLDKAGSVRCHSDDPSFIGGDPSLDAGGWATLELPFEGPVVDIVAMPQSVCAHNSQGELACWGTELVGDDAGDGIGIVSIRYAATGGAPGE